MNLLEQGLLWLDADRARYWAVAWFAYGAVVLLALFPPRAGTAPATRRLNAVLFGAAVFLVLAAFRWPVWFFPKDLNPDEAQIVAGAITLDRLPVYWKYVDGTTHGPVCEYLLLAAHWCGAPLNYITARVLGVMLQAGALWAAWGTLRLFMSERFARIGILPGLTFWAFVTWEDFVHYSTELPGLFCLAVGGWLAAIVLRAAAVRPRQLVLASLAGLAIGIVPFAKLQSVPQGVGLALIVLALLWWGRRDLPARQRLQLGGVFVAGGLVPALLVAGFVSVYGLWEHFRASYILSALDYLTISEHPPGQMPMRFLYFSATEPAFAWLFWGGLGFSLLYARAATAEKSLRFARIAGWLLLGAAYYSVLRPAREVVHYLHLLVIPLTILVGLTLAIAVEEARQIGENGARQPGLNRAMPWLSLGLLVLLPQFYQRQVSWNQFAGQMHEYRATPISEAARFIRERERAGDTVAMWGWEPNLLVQANLPHGTREAHSANQMMAWPLRPYYVARYLWDMERRQPEWFVDVVGKDAFAFEDRPNQAHEALPALNTLISTQYEFMAEFQNKRIYRRKAAPSR
jgi:hypothetical protein